MSYAIEFLFFPDFAGLSPLPLSSLLMELIMLGNLASPNVFSDNLLNNIGNISGAKPYIRVGGNSADLAIYDSSLVPPTHANWVATAGTPGEHPLNINIGPSFFEGYSSFPGSKFIHNLNLKNATSSASGWNSLLETIPVACQALSGKLLFWEYGNEPDYYPRSPSSWNDSSYVTDWGNGTTAIKDKLASACPDMASGDAYGYVGPSLAQLDRLPPMGLFQNGLNDNGTMKQYTMHQ